MGNWIWAETILCRQVQAYGYKSPYSYIKTKLVRLKDLQLESLQLVVQESRRVKNL